MGTLRNGFLGNYKGKIGNLVFYEVKSRQVIRMAGKSNKPPTVGQLQNRNEMAAVMAFLKPIRAFINIGFSAKAKGTIKTANNMAVSYNKKNAVTGVYPNAMMDYSKVLVTEGGMEQVISPTVELLAGALNFTWLCPNHLDWPRPYDQVMLMAYFPTLQRAEYILYGAKRLKCKEVLPIPADLVGEYMEVYISFIAEDRKRIANSTYLGAVNAE